MPPASCDPCRRNGRAQRAPCRRHGSKARGNSVRFRRVQFLRQPSLKPSFRARWEIGTYKCRRVSVMFFMPSNAFNSRRKYFISKWIPDPEFPALDKILKFRIFSTLIMRLPSGPFVLLKTGKFNRALMAIQSRVYFWKTRNKPWGGPNLQSSMIDSLLVGKERRS